MSIDTSAKLKGTTASHLFDIIRLLDNIPLQRNDHPKVSPVSHIFNAYTNHITSHV